MAYARFKLPATLIHSNSRYQKDFRDAVESAFGVTINRGQHTTDMEVVTTAEQLVKFLGLCTKAGIIEYIPMQLLEIRVQQSTQTVIQDWTPQKQICKDIQS